MLRRCSATPAWSTWRSTAPSPNTLPRSPGRTTRLAPDSFFLPLRGGSIPFILTSHARTHNTAHTTPHTHTHTQHSVNNPYSQFRDEYSMEDILKSRQVFGPLTMLQVQAHTPLSGLVNWPESAVFWADDRSLPRGVGGGWWCAVLPHFRWCRCGRCVQRRVRQEAQPPAPGTCVCVCCVPCVSWNDA